MTTEATTPQRQLRASCARVHPPRVLATPEPSAAGLCSVEDAGSFKSCSLRNLTSTRTSLLAASTADSAATMAIDCVQPPSILRGGACVGMSRALRPMRLRPI
jgi:hypothetical protein